MAALKILDNPALDGELPFFSAPEGRALLKRFQALRQMFDRSDVEPISCVVCPDRASAEPWLQRRHAGELNGIGLTGWSAIERDRAHNPNSPIVALVDYLRREGLSEYEEQVVQQQYTTVERIVDTLAARQLLGLQINGGVLCSLTHPDRLNAVLKALLAKIGATPAPSRLLNKADSIRQFVEDLPTDILPNPADFTTAVALKGLREHYRPAEPEAPDSQSGGAPFPPSPPAPSPPAPPRASPSRKTVLKRNEVPVTDPRAKAVLTELATLKHEDHPTAVTVLFRIFLEMTVREYAKRYNISVGKKGHEKLSDFIVESFRHISAARAGVDISAVERVIRAGLLPHHVDVLNRVVHDKFAFASAEDIGAIADTFRPFLVALWTELR